MSAAPTPRRLSIAITAAVASVTLAIGVTAASLLGWLRPPEPASEQAPVTPATSVEPAVAPALPADPSPPPVPADEIFVSPEDVTLAMQHEREDDGEDRDHEHARGHDRDHDRQRDREGGDDD